MRSGPWGAGPVTGQSHCSSNYGAVPMGQPGSRGGGVWGGATERPGLVGGAKSLLWSGHHSNSHILSPFRAYTEGNGPGKTSKASPGPYPGGPYPGSPWASQR